MLKKLLGALGRGSAAREAQSPRPMFEPYAEPHVNVLYNLLFCDDVNLFRAGTQPADGPWPALLAEHPDTTALRKIADDETNEGRIRALAYHRLRAAAESVVVKKLLGVIVEVPLQQGLDVLAAFSDGGVRYLHQSGKVAIFDGAGHPVESVARELIAVAQPLVERLGPWDRPRLPPPRGDHVRLTFLVSDGLYFGEGPFPALNQDALAKPVLDKATELLQRVVKVGRE